MKKNQVFRICVASGLVFGLCGCATSPMAGVEKSRAHVEEIRTIIDNRPEIIRLSDYEGIALLRMAKLGAFGFGAIGQTVSVYVRNENTKAFGPPVFSDGGGVSAGIAYGGLNIVDCLILFRRREDAICFAENPVSFNFSNEASFLIWGRKQMTPIGGVSYSDGAGLCVGAIELELVFSAPRSALHRNLYGGEVSVRRILTGSVAVPPELQAVITELNTLASTTSRHH